MSTEDYPSHDLIIEADATSEEIGLEVETAARQRTENMFRLWRSHFADEVGTIEREYATDHGTSISLSSASPTKLTAAKTTPAAITTYEFDANSDGLMAHHTDTVSGETTLGVDHVTNYNTLARLIFTGCEYEADLQDGI